MDREKAGQQPDNFAATVRLDTVKPQVRTTFRRARLQRGVTGSIPVAPTNRMPGSTSQCVHHAGSRRKARRGTGSSSLLGGGVCRLVHDVDGGPARLLIGGQEAAGDLRGLFNHGE